MTDTELAELIFPQVQRTIADLEKQYPPRALAPGAFVSRFAPSPTGFLHTGSLFTAMVAEKVARDSHGLFYLRLEDTDTRRTIEGAATQMLSEMRDFGIVPDEGYLGSHEAGQYGPYQQSERREIYQIVLKHMLQNGLAYPCFCQESQLQELRLVQEQNKVLPGYYGEYAICRHLDLASAAARIKAGEPYVLRFRSAGDHHRKIDVNDLIRGTINIAENDQDIVIYKSDGLPTYHFAHAVDDHFMRTNIVVRGEEWISSLPLHYQLFRALDFAIPQYAHLPVIMKIDAENGHKRKLSKRKDPEAAVSYFLERGYPSAAIIIYLMTIANSNFEEWLMEHGIKNYLVFPFSFQKVSLEGALFDLKKLSFYAKEYLAQLRASEITDYALDYAQKYDPNLLKLIQSDRAYFEKIMNIERDQDKPRKDYQMLADIFPAIQFFYDDLYLELLHQNELLFNPKLPLAIVLEVLERLKTQMLYDTDQQSWFNNLVDLGSAEPFKGSDKRFATSNKDYKANPEMYLGNPADIAEILRIGLTTSLTSPNLFMVLQILGRDRVNARLDAVIKKVRER